MTHEAPQQNLLPHATQTATCGRFFKVLSNAKCSAFGKRLFWDQRIKHYHQIRLKQCQQEKYTNRVYRPVSYCYRLWLLTSSWILIQIKTFRLLMRYIDTLNTGTREPQSRSRLIAIPSSFGYTSCGLADLPSPLCPTKSPTKSPSNMHH